MEYGARAGLEVVAHEKWQKGQWLSPPVDDQSRQLAGRGSRATVDGWANERQAVNVVGMAGRELGCDLAAKRVSNPGRAVKADRSSPRSQQRGVLGQVKTAGSRRAVSTPGEVDDENRVLGTDQPRRRQHRLAGQPETRNKDDGRAVPGGRRIPRMESDPCRSEGNLGGDFLEAAPEGHDGWTVADRHGAGVTASRGRDSAKPADAERSLCWFLGRLRALEVFLEFFGTALQARDQQGRRKTEDSGIDDALGPLAQVEEIGQRRGFGLWAPCLGIRLVGCVLQRFGKNSDKGGPGNGGDPREQRCVDQSRCAETEVLFGGPVGG